MSMESAHEHGFPEHVSVHCVEHGIACGNYLLRYTLLGTSSTISSA